KSTNTSCPTRGKFVPPKLPPAHGCATWIQHDDLSSILLSRSQWKCTRTRPNSSVWISSPGGPTTVALSTPITFGLGVTSGDRYGASALAGSAVCVHFTEGVA